MWRVPIYVAAPVLAATVYLALSYTANRFVYFPGEVSGRAVERAGGPARDYLSKAGFRPDQIVIHGESLGTAVAVDLAARRPCATVVLEAPFTSAKDVAQTVAPVIGPILIWGFDSRAKIGRIHAPIFFIHGDRDRVVSLRLGQGLFAAAHEPRSFWLVWGTGHNDIAETAGPAYRQRLRAFYESLPKPTH
jgi:fermentation-respiration switch protein FrsA (DUF1100 family)